MTTTRQTPARTFLVELICDCGTSMEFEGIVLNSYPAQYPHRCLACGKVKDQSYVYPYYRHDPLARPAAIGEVK